MHSFLKLSAALILAATQVSAHYIWPRFIVNGALGTTDWQYIRQSNNWQDLNPQTDVTTSDIRCYNSQKLNTPSTITVAAGSQVGFNVIGNPSNLYHPGVVNVYMAQAPSGTALASWDPTGAVWFKVYQITANANGVEIDFPALNLTQITFTIPAATPSGNYLIRTEHIALHSASYYGGAQFYISCAQVTVTGGGNGTPGPLVAFPGAYTGNEPGILINIYYPIPTSYVQPGPAVWGGGSGGSTGTGTGTGSTTTIKSTTTTTSTTTTQPPSTTGQPQYAQCGGQGWAGATTCVSPFKCTVVNQYYSQCL